MLVVFHSACLDVFGRRKSGGLQNSAMHTWERNQDVVLK